MILRWYATLEGTKVLQYYDYNFPGNWTDVKTIKELDIVPQGKKEQPVGASFQWQYKCEPKDYRPYAPMGVIFKTGDRFTGDGKTLGPEISKIKFDFFHYNGQTLSVGGVALTPREAQIAIAAYLEGKKQ